MQYGLSLKKRVNTLRWVVPIILVLTVVIYQLGLARFVHENYTEAVHFGVEILFFATTGPLVTFWFLTRIGHWLDEKETTDKIAQINELRLASITTASADAILGLDNLGNIESWNLGAQLIFDYTPQEMLGKPLSTIFGEGDSAEVEFQWLVAAVKESGFIRGHQTVCQRANGILINAEITITHVTGAQGESLGMSVILRDITARTQREREIKELNSKLNRQVFERTNQLAKNVEELEKANQELLKLDHMRTEFVSLVSHQIRAPLTNVRGAVERMQTDCSIANTTCSRMFNIVDQQVVRLDNLVQDVLNATRIEAGELVLHPEPISALPILQQVVEQIGTRISDREIHLGEKPGLPLIFGDRDRITEVLVNLLDNADKYSPPGTDMFVDVRADQSIVTFSVHDQGPGLPDGTSDRVFEKFFRTEKGDSQQAYGYGLGLYVCKLLVEAQGGSIWADNHPDGGAVFSFTVPVWQEYEV